MARIFLSHSSKDNSQARALGDWLAGNGWPAEDVFLDIDKSGGIAPGERWQKALNDAANRCEAVIFLISRNWLASSWCLEELSLANKLNKRLFGVLIGDVKLADIPARLRDEWQQIDLDSGRDGMRFDVELPGGKQGHATFSRSGLEKLRVGLIKAGLDPRHFEWPPKDDPNRPPYRGLAAMEAEDAGIFYGREAATIAALDQLRGLTETSPPRLLSVLGASGAGKSSFMRAGLIPRLRRDEHHFLVLPVLRPQRAAITGDSGLAASLAAAGETFRLRWTRAQAVKAIESGADAVAALLEGLTAASAKGLGPVRDASPLTIIVPLDQAEELFQAEGSAEATTLLSLLADLLGREEPRLIVLATIRTDSYEQMQAAAELTGIRQATFSLPALARGAYQRVIEGPAERLRGSDRALRIEPALTGALLADIEQGGAKDALPLLAFTLERLYRDHGTKGELTLADYRDSGGIAGAIEAAVERAFAAADGDLRLPRERQARLALLRRAMIPWLAGVDPDTNSPRRQVARFADIPDEARPLVEHLVEQRLLTSDTNPETGERTVEPAHEALLRQWGLVDGWLKEDIAVLASLEGVRRAARDWDANARHEGWLQHAGSRLADAESVQVRADLARRLDPADLAYLAACRSAENARVDRERRSARLIRFAAVAATLLAIAAAGAAWWGWERAREAEMATELANRALAESAELANSLSKESARQSVKIADTLVDRGQPDAAALLLLSAARTFETDHGLQPEEFPQDMRITLDRVGEALQSRVVTPVPGNILGVESAEGIFLIDQDTFSVSHFGPDGLQAFSPSAENLTGTILRAAAAPSGQLTFVLTNGKILRVSRAEAPKTIGQITIEEDEEPGSYSFHIWNDGSVTNGDRFFDPDGVSATLTDTDWSWARHYLRSADGRRYLWGGAYENDDGTAHLYEIKRDGSQILFEKATLGGDAFDRLLEASCYAQGMPGNAPGKTFMKFDNGGATEGSCIWFDTDGDITTVYSNWTSGTAGLFYNHTVHGEYGEPRSLEEIITSISKLTPDENSLTWVGVDKANGLFGAVMGRSLLVFDDQTLHLNRKHGGQIGPAHFFPDGRIAVFDRTMAAIVTYGPKLSDREDLPDDADWIYLNPVNCGDSRIDLGDGFSIVLAEGESRLQDASGAYDIRLADSNCVRLSADRSMLMALVENRLLVFDVRALVEDKAVSRRNMMELPSKTTSAYFLKDGSIIANDAGNLVLQWEKADRVSEDWSERWSAKKIYDGERPVLDAEPSPDGEALLITEHLGASQLRVFLYGLPSQRIWKVLGEEYKHISAAFSQEGAILLYKNSTFQSIPVKQNVQLLGELKAGLAEQCKPSMVDDYRTSPCWPE